MIERYKIGYWFKPEKKKDLTYGRYLYECCNEIGVSRDFLSRVINRRTPIKHKTVAYAMAKYINKDYEIQDVFEIKSLQKKEE